MDSIDPAAYLSTLMSPVSKALPSRAGGTDVDQQILALAKTQPPQATTSDGNSQAAKAAYDAAQGKQQYLKFGPWTTPVPLPHWLDNTLGGMGGRALQLGESAKQTLGGSVDPLNAAVAQQLQTGTAGKVGSFLTDTIATAPLGGASTAGVARLGGLGARVAGNAFSRAAIQGAVQGAATAPPGSRLEGAALGAALSPVVPAAGAALGKVASGLTRTPEAQALLDRGVQLTPGQMNPKGVVVNRTEQAMTALPWVGGAIAKARAAGPQQYARSMVQDALAPGAKLSTASQDFNDWIAEAQHGYDQAYAGALRTNSPGGGFRLEPKLTTPDGTDVPLSDAFTQLAATPRLGMTAASRQSMGEELQAKLDETLAVANRSGGLRADDLQKLRSDLRDAARGVSPIDNASRALKGFWTAAQGTVTQALESQLPQEASQALRSIDQQYGKFSIVRDVARQLKDRGEATPAQFTNAIARATAPGAYAAGGGFNRNLSKAAQSVFSSTVPQTGLTGAGTVLPLVEGIGAGLLAPHNPPLALGTGAAIGALRGAYTPPGLRALAGQTAWQQAMQRRLASVPPAARDAISRYLQGGLLSGPLQQLQPPQASGGLMGGQ